MGNLSRLTGSIKLDPPLTAQQALDIASKAEWNSGQADWTLTEDFGAICPANESWWKQYDATDGLKWWLSQLPPDTTASGLVLWESQEGGSVVMAVVNGTVADEVTIEIESASAFIDHFSNVLDRKLRAKPHKDSKGVSALKDALKDAFKRVAVAALKTALKTYKNPQHKTPEHVGYICDWAAEQRETQLRAEVARAAFEKAAGPG